MDAANENVGPSNEVGVQPPAYGGPSADEDVPIRDGLYILTNKMARTVLDLWHSKSGTQCQAWTQHTGGGGLGNQIWIVCKSPARDTYTLRNINHAAFLDLLAGNAENGAAVIGHHRVEGSKNQEWRIVEQAPHYYTLQCAKTNTYLEIPEGNSANGTKITCSKEASERDHQLWILDKASSSGREIQAIIGQWKPDLMPRLLLHHGNDVEYLGLPRTFYRTLWEKAELQRQPLRPHLFDYDLFIIKCKDSVHCWAKDTFPLQTRGFGILFGMIYGEAKKGPKAYNWYLTSDMCSLVFFDPQTGKEYSATALNGFGFEPTFAML